MFDSSTYIYIYLYVRYKNICIYFFIYLFTLIYFFICLFIVVWCIACRCKHRTCKSFAFLWMCVVREMPITALYFFIYIYIYIYAKPRQDSADSEHGDVQVQICHPEVHAFERSRLRSLERMSRSCSSPRCGFTRATWCCTERTAHQINSVIVWLVLRRNATVNSVHWLLLS